MIIDYQLWADFKTDILAKGFPYNHQTMRDLNGTFTGYLVFVLDRTIEWQCAVNKTADVTDFETNYKANSNRNTVYNVAGTPQVYTSGSAMFVYVSGGSIDAAISGQAIATSVSGNSVNVSGNVVNVSGNAVYVYISGGTMTAIVSGGTVTASISGQQVYAVTVPLYKTAAGVYYECDDYVNPMSLNATRDWVILTSNAPIAFSYIATTKFEYYITFNESPTVTSNGTKLTITNLNRESGFTTVTSIYTSSNVSSVGTQLEQRFIPYSSLSLTYVTESRNFKLKRNTKYLFRAKSLAASNVINPVFYFYEGEL